jgi:hypothetical protein
VGIKLSNDRTSASTVIKVLRTVSAPEAVLLRGRSSILAGKSQNDIDIFIPKSAWDRLRLSEHYENFEVRKSGYGQLKVNLVEPISNEAVEIDVFHEITWRGIVIVNVEDLPTVLINDLELRSLDSEAEGWLTVVKNVLHGRSTPLYKVCEVSGKPVFSVVEKPSNFRSALNQTLLNAAWSCVGGGSSAMRFGAVWRARFSLIMIRASEKFSSTVLRVAIWLMWRITTGRKRH